MKVAIHQPNFIPWIGLFEKINSVDKFIIFDHVQASRGKSWINRNKILFNNQVRWLTIPIRKSNLQLIRDVEINYDSDFMKSHFGILKQEYFKSPFFSHYFDFFSDIYHQKEKFLKDFNLKILLFFCKELNIHTEFISSSDLVNQNKHLQNLNGNDLIVELCKVVNAEFYLSGTGCKDFILPSSFENQNIEFKFQKSNFQQFATTSGEQLSILDHAFRNGLDEIREELNINLYEPRTKNT